MGNRVSGKRRKKQKRTQYHPELRRYGRVKWVPIQLVQPVHHVRHAHHLQRLVRSMRRAHPTGCMWRGRPLLVERLKKAKTCGCHWGIRWMAWTGSHRLAAAFAAGQWMVPIIEIDMRLFTAAHGKGRHRSRLSDTIEDIDRLRMLQATADERAIRLMKREIPRERPRKEPPPAPGAPAWESIGDDLEARRVSKDLVDIRHTRSGDTFLFHRSVLEESLAFLRKTEKAA